MNTKPFYKSVTLWVNFIILFIALIDAEYLKQLGVPETAVTIAVASLTKVTAVLNIGLRLFVTKQPIDMGQK